MGHTEGIYYNSEDEAQGRSDVTEAQDRRVLSQGPEATEEAPAAAEMPYRQTGEKF